MTSVAGLLLLLGLGYYFGRARERRHVQSVFKREQECQVNVTNVISKIPIGETFLVAGSVVIASDYFKTVTEAVHNLFGGRLRQFERMLERGRREALLRMRESAERQGASRVINTRIETSSIGFGVGGKGLPCFEVVAYGTALKENQSFEG